MIKDGHEFFNQKYLANCFRKFFVIIGRSLSSIIPESQSKFERYLNPHQTFMGEANLTDVELKETLRSLKHNKVSGYDSISSNVVKETSDIIFTTFKRIFNLSLQQAIFSKNLKIVKAFPIFKKMKTFNWQITSEHQFSLTFLNCWHIYCVISSNTFQKVVPFTKKQFVFQTCYSTEYAILQIVNQEF